MDKTHYTFTKSLQPIFKLTISPLLFDVLLNETKEQCGNKTISVVLLQKRVLMSVKFVLSAGTFSLPHLIILQIQQCAPRKFPNEAQGIGMKCISVRSWIKTLSTVLLLFLCFERLSRRS